MTVGAGVSDDAVQAVARVTQAGHDVRVLVEALVDRRDDDLHVRAVTDELLDDVQSAIHADLFRQIEITES